MNDKQYNFRNVSNILKGFCNILKGIYLEQQHSRKNISQSCFFFEKFFFWIVWKQKLFKYFLVPKEKKLFRRRNQCMSTSCNGVNIYGDFEEEHIHKFSQFFRRKISKRSQNLYPKFVGKKTSSCFMPPWSYIIIDPWTNKEYFDIKKKESQRF